MTGMSESGGTLGKQGSLIMQTRNAGRGRRNFLRKSAALPSTLLLLALGDAYGRPGEVSVTPACAGEDAPTRQQTAGPFFLPHSPQRASLLEPGIDGTRIVLSGRVVSTHAGRFPGLCSISGMPTTPASTTSKGSGSAAINSRTAKGATGWRRFFPGYTPDEHDISM
jgi:hypothetical protein